MVGIELVEDRKTRQPYPFELRMGHKVTMEARGRGTIVRPLGNVVVLMPPLSISEDEIDMLVDTVYASIVEVMSVNKED